MTKDEVILDLLNRNYLAKLSEDNFVITNKLERDWNAIPEIIKLGTPSGLPKTEEIVLYSPSELLKKFIKDCVIPFRAKTSQGAFYQLAAESEYARKYLYNVLNTKQYKYEDLVKATSSYYTNERMARVTLTNYFKLGTIDQVMTEFLANPNSVGTVLPKTNKVSL